MPEYVPITRNKLVLMPMFAMKGLKTLIENWRIKVLNVDHHFFCNKKQTRCIFFQEDLTKDQQICRNCLKLLPEFLKHSWFYTMENLSRSDSPILLACPMNQQNGLLFTGKMLLNIQITRKLVLHERNMHQKYSISGVWEN
ncbi:hypothetical protein RclHR1_02520010 [Rhizophagus clarus]|uniref:Uncharacterized protein n=1 Tax=Rhizophagus clarus TaxID=94130 RepID=A0A2Z6R0D6_9GLOM|nr:hypothetical protein RclHR1_02520010 [Rhizophagus clarus]